jgi:hypothetical protein
VRGPAAAPASSAADLRLERTALWSMLAAKAVAAWGVQWDIRWHVAIGRDSFWIAPHVMTYAGVALIALSSFGVLAARTWRGGGPAPVRMLGLAGSRGIHLAAWGIALTILAAPIDDLWHRLFGLDVTIWSPPHLLGILGSVVNSVACLLVAREAHPAGRAAGAALVVSGALLYANLHLVLEPSTLVAYRHGGVRFYTLAMLSAALLPIALVATTLLSGRRWAAVGIVLAVILLGQAGHRVGDAGFAWLQPESVIEEEVRKDPASPIATAWAIARQNGTPPGRTGGPIHVAALFPAVVMAVADPRRRPRAAAVAWAGATFVAVLLLLAARPAFAPLVPPWPVALVALAVTVLAALASARAAGWLAGALAAGPPPVAAATPLPVRAEAPVSGR